MKSDGNEDLNQVDEVAKAGVKSPANTAAAVITPTAPAVALAEKAAEKIDVLKGTVASTPASISASTPSPVSVPVKEPAVIAALAPASALAEKAADKIGIVTGAVATTPSPVLVPVKEPAAVTASPALAEKAAEKLDTLTETISSFSPPSISTSSSSPFPALTKEPAPVISPPAPAIALAEKAVEKTDVLTGTVTTPPSITTSSPVPVPGPSKVPATIIAPPAPVAALAEKAVEKTDVLTGTVTTPPSITTSSPVPVPGPSKVPATIIAPPALVAAIALAEKAVEKTDVLTGTVTTPPSITTSSPVPVPGPSKVPATIIAPPALVAAIALAEKAVEKTDVLTGTVTTPPSITTSSPVPVPGPSKVPATIIAPPALVAAIALAEKAVEKTDVLTGTTPSSTSTSLPLLTKEPAAIIAPPPVPAVMLTEKFIEKLDITAASVTTSSPSPVAVQEVKNVEDDHSKAQVALEIKDITEQNNGSESASADVDAGDVKEKEKEKEKDAPAGTWNTWLGNTGMKAAGLGMGIASAGWDATRTSIAKVQNFGSGNPKYVKAYKSFSNESLSIEIMVSAGTATSIPFFVPKGSEMIWKVMVKSLDISFSLKQRLQEDGGAVEVELEVPRKITSGEMAVGTRDAVENEDRRILICVSNAHNKLQSKMLTYQVLIALPDKVAEMKAHYASQEQEYADDVTGDSTAAAAAAVTSDSKGKAEAPASIKEKGQDEGDKEGDRDVLVDVDTKGEEVPSGNSYMNNFYAISSSVMKRAQSATAVQYIQNTGGGMMSKLWGKKTEDASSAAEEELETKGVSYDIDSERDEGGDGSYDEEERRASQFASTLPTAERDIYGNMMSADSGDGSGTEGVVIAPKIQY